MQNSNDCICCLLCGAGGYLGLEPGLYNIISNMWVECFVENLSWIWNVIERKKGLLQSQTNASFSLVEQKVSLWRVIDKVPRGAKKSSRIDFRQNHIKLWKLHFQKKNIIFLGSSTHCTDIPHLKLKKMCICAKPHQRVATFEVCVANCEDEAEMAFVRASSINQQ